MGSNPLVVTPQSRRASRRSLKAQHQTDFKRGATAKMVAKMAKKLERRPFTRWPFTNPPKRNRSHGSKNVSVATETLRSRVAICCSRRAPSSTSRVEDTKFSRLLEELANLQSIDASASSRSLYQILNVLQTTLTHGISYRQNPIGRWACGKPGVQALMAPVFSSTRLSKVSLSDYQTPATTRRDR